MSKKRHPIPSRSTYSDHKNSAQDLLVKGFSLHQKGDLLAAGQIYAEILKVQPLHFDALHLSGLIAAQSGQLDAAFELLSKAISINPKNSPAHCNLGNVHLNQGGYELAIESYSKALNLKHNYEEAIYSRGLAYQRLGQFNQAEADYKSALSINPNHVGTLTNLGNVFQLQKKYSEAIAAYGQAIDLNLPFAEPFNNRGNLYHEQRRFEEALSDFNKALAINPNYPEALSNRANSLFYLKHYDLALEDYQKALLLRPNYAEALHNRGNLYRELGRYELAMADYDLALTIKPDYEYLKGVHFATKMNICDWSNLESEWKNVCVDIELSKKTIAPFMVIPISDSIDLQRKVAEHWVKEKHPILLTPKFKSSYQIDKKIRIGYFSADFHEHATMYLMAQLFELHDKNNFEIIGFSFGPDKQDSMRKRALAAFDQFYDVRDKTDEEVAQFSRDLGVDIAVDLKGFTLDARTGIFANRAAPIQINYLGYPGTMGADFIDYIIADRIIIPEHLQNKYSEKVLYMPDCYQINDRTREIAPTKYSRESLGLPSSGFIYCSFNANYKITPTVFDSWMRILKRVEGSVLWLFEDNERSASNLKQEAEKRGVDPSRIFFAKRAPLSEHLARQKVADLFLDTWPCNAHTTTSDALWAGLPVLTFPGEGFASRVAASLVHAVGLSDLVRGSQSEYEEFAIELAKSNDNLLKIRDRLKLDLNESSLFNTKRFVSNLEKLYQDVFILNRGNHQQ
jgi:predicted O-linked N-acetylglucosamine transferase (SPINDLY family)